MCSSQETSLRSFIHLEVLVDHEVTANQVKVAQLSFQLGFDSKETLDHDLLHSLLKKGKCRKTDRWTDRRVASSQSQSLLRQNVTQVKRTFWSCIHAVLETCQQLSARLTVKTPSTQSSGRPLASLNFSLTYVLNLSMDHTVSSFSTL